MAGAGRERCASRAQYDAADELYRRVQPHDAANARAAAGWSRSRPTGATRAIVAAAEQAGARPASYREAQDVLRPVLTENPQQRDARRMQRLIEERMVKPAIVSAAAAAGGPSRSRSSCATCTLRTVFDVLQRATGINFVFDRDVRADQRTSITLRDAELEDADPPGAATNQLEQKVLNESTVLVYPNTPQKLREYQELVVKGFYVANADVKQTANMMRTLVKTRDMFIDEKISLLVIKDTPAAVRLAERLIAAQDLAEPEVMLEVEVLEVGANRLLRARHALPRLARGRPGRRRPASRARLTLHRMANRSSDLVQLHLHRSAVPVQPASSRTARPTCSPIRASA